MQQESVEWVELRREVLGHGGRAFSHRKLHGRDGP
jgi:hypothetical protein